MTDPRVWGTSIGAIGATVFVFANRGLLPGPWPVVALVAWVLLVVTYVLTVFGLRRRLRRAGPVSRWARLVYLGAVILMVVGIGIGIRIIQARGLHRAEGAVIAFFVGLHFLPFARAFATPFFAVLGSALMVTGAVGLVLAATWTVTAGAAAAVLAGLVMLALISGDALWGSRRPPDTG